MHLAVKATVFPHFPCSKCQKLKRATVCSATAGLPPSFSLSRPPQNTKLQQMCLPLSVFPVGLQKRDALCVLRKREGKKQRIKEHVNFVEELKR